MTATTLDLPWAGLLDLIFGQRCTARREPRRGRAFHGRCELTRAHRGDHALERGMHTERWSTRSTDIDEPTGAVLEQLADDVRAASSPLLSIDRKKLGAVAARLYVLAGKDDTT